MRHLILSYVRIFLLVFLGVFSVEQASALKKDLKAPETETSQVEAFIRSMGNKVIQILSNPSVSREERKNTFLGILDSSFAVPSIGKFVLGKHWKTLSPEKRETYLKLFKKSVAHSYAIRFEDYKGETFQVIKARAPDPGKKNWKVFSEVLRPDGQKTKVEWLVVEGNHGLRVLDVIVENVSMSVTQRSEYAAVISKDGMDGFLEKLAQ